MDITKDIKYVGVNDHEIDLFEGMYDVPNGMAYNSYVILDEKTAVMDSVAEGFGEERLKNIGNVLGGKAPDYLVVQHMEPDHSANVKLLCDKYPEMKIVASQKAFAFMEQSFEVFRQFVRPWSPDPFHRHPPSRDRSPWFPP